MSKKNNKPNNEKKSKDKKIVKSNKLKITIITIIILTLLTGIGVGIYFIVRDKSMDLPENLNASVIKPKEIKNKLQEEGRTENTGVFFYTSDDVSKFLLWGDAEETKGDGIGPFTVYSQNSNTNWYAINIDDYKSIREDIINVIFINDTELYDGFENSNSHPFKYKSSLSYDSSLTIGDIEKDILATDEYSVQINDTDDENLYVDLVPPTTMPVDPETGETSSSEAELSVNGGTMMWFDTTSSANLEFMIQNVAIPDESSGININDAMDYYESYFIAIDEAIENNDI